MQKLALFWFIPLGIHAPKCRQRSEPFGRCGAGLGTATFGDQKLSAPQNGDSDIRIHLWHLFNSLRFPFQTGSHVTHVQVQEADLVAGRWRLAAVDLGPARLGRIHIDHMP